MHFTLIRIRCLHQSLVTFHIFSYRYTSKVSVLVLFALNVLHVYVDLAVATLEILLHCIKFELERPAA